MSNEHRQKWQRREIRAAFACLGLSIGFALYPALQYVLQPVPYRNVEIVGKTRAGDWLNVIATFTKTACQIERLEVVGSAVGVPEFLIWRHLGQLTPEEHDRTVGRHAFRVAIYVDARAYDWIELRTRHDCAGERVDRVFARIVEVPAS